MGKNCYYDSIIKYFIGQSIFKVETLFVKAGYFQINIIIKCDAFLHFNMAVRADGFDLKF